LDIFLSTVQLPLITVKVGIGIASGNDYIITVICDALVTLPLNWQKKGCHKHKTKNIPPLLKDCKFFPEKNFFGQNSRKSLK
jgi:hypothetical protein